MKNESSGFNYYLVSYVSIVKECKGCKIYGKLL